MHLRKLGDTHIPSELQYLVTKPKTYQYIYLLKYWECVFINLFIRFMFFNLESSIKLLPIWFSGQGSFLVVPASVVFHIIPSDCSLLHPFCSTDLKQNQKATKMSNNSSQWIQFIYPPTPKPLSKTTKNMMLYFIKKFKINSSSFFHLEFLTLNNINICIMCLFIELICFTPHLFQKFLFNSRGWITFI